MKSWIKHTVYRHENRLDDRKASFGSSPNDSIQNPTKTWNLKYQCNYTCKYHVTRVWKKDISVPPCHRVSCQRHMEGGDRQIGEWQGIYEVDIKLVFGLIHVLCSGNSMKFSFENDGHFCCRGITPFPSSFRFFPSNVLMLFLFFLNSVHHCIKRRIFRTYNARCLSTLLETKNRYYIEGNNLQSRIVIGNYSVNKPLKALVPAAIQSSLVWMIKKMSCRNCKCAFRIWARKWSHHSLRPFKTGSCRCWMPKGAVLPNETN